MTAADQRNGVFQRLRGPAKFSNLRQLTVWRLASASAVIGLASHAASAAAVSWAAPAVNNDTAVHSTASSATLTVTNGTKYAVGDLIQFYGTSSTTNPFSTSPRSYFIVNVTGNTIQVSATPGGTALAAANSTSASTTYQFQDWLTTTNWTGGAYPNSNTATASFPSGLAANVPGVSVNGNVTVNGLSMNVGNGTLAFVSGANGKNLYTLTFATSDSSTPVITQVATTRSLQFGLAGGLALALGGTQGLIVNGQAGGAITGSGLNATSSNAVQKVAFNNINYNNFTGTTGIIVQQGELGLQLASAIGTGSTTQNVSVGNAATLTNNKLAGLSLATSETIGGLNGNNLARVWSQNSTQTLTVGANDATGGNFAGVIGTDFTGTSLGSALNFAKIGGGVQTISGNIVGSGSVVANGAGGTLILSGINTYTGGTTVSAGTLSLVDNAQLKFVLGDNGVSNSIIVGSDGSLSLGGDFNVDTSNAVANLGNAWSLVSNSGTANYLSTFTLLGFTEAADQIHWTKPIDAERQFEFSDSTGTLSVVAVPEPAAAAGLLLLAGLAMNARRRHGRTDGSET